LPYASTTIRLVALAMALGLVGRVAVALALERVDLVVLDWRAALRFHLEG